MSRRIVGLLILVLVVTTVAATCGPSTPTPTPAPKGGQPKHGGILTYGLVNDPTSMDPHILRGAADQTIVGLVYNRLVTHDRNMKVVPDLAEKWAVVNDTTFDFTLRKGVSFHNGDELTSEDVVFSFGRIQNPETGSSAAGSLKGIKAEATDKYSVRLTLPAPNAAILSELARLDAGIVNKKFVEGGGNLSQTMMGTGPFKFKAREPNVSFELERFDNYFIQPLPYLDGIKFIPYSDETAKVTALRTGVLDMMDYVPWQHMDAIERDAQEGKFKFYSDSQALFMTLYMNPSEPPFNDKRMRQAVNWAFDRDGYAKAVFFGRGEKMTGSFIPQAFLGYDPSLDGTYGYDPEKAKKLLEEVGWRDENGDGVREAHGVPGVADGTPLKINFLAANPWAMHYRLAELAQANMKEIGMDGTVELVDWPTRTQRRLDVKAWEIQADGLGPAITDPSFMNAYFHSASGDWPKRMHWADPAVDELLSKAQATYDEAERKRLYNEVDKRMLDESYFVYVWRREQGEASQPYVMGFYHTFGVLSFMSLPEVWLDK